MDDAASSDRCVFRLASLPAACFACSPMGGTVLRSWSSYSEGSDDNDSLPEVATRGVQQAAVGSSNATVAMNPMYQNISSTATLASQRRVAAYGAEQMQLRGMQPLYGDGTVLLGVATSAAMLGEPLWEVVRFWGVGVTMLMCAGRATGESPRAHGRCQRHAPDPGELLPCRGALLGARARPVGLTPAFAPGPQGRRGFSPLYESVASLQSSAQPSARPGPAPPLRRTMRPPAAQTPARFLPPLYEVPTPQQGQALSRAPRSLLRAPVLPGPMYSEAVTPHWVRQPMPGQALYTSVVTPSLAVKTPAGALRHYSVIDTPMATPGMVVYNPVNRRSGHAGQEGRSPAIFSQL